MEVRTYFAVDKKSSLNGVVCNHHGHNFDRRSRKEQKEKKKKE